MPQIRYLVGGVENVETIPEALVDYYSGRLGYTVVVSEDDAAELKGDALLEAARNAGVEAPTTLTADEKRDAIVALTAPAGEPIPPHAPPADPTPDELAAAELDPSTPDPEPATKPAGKRRAAADSEE